jgi:hypothetical protein
MTGGLYGRVFPMRWNCWWAVVMWLTVASAGLAADGEQLAPDQLPPGVVSRIREFGAEPLHARKEAENGKVCYIVTAMDKGQVIEIFASPDGAALARKTEEFSLARWPSQLVALTLFVLLPGVLVGLAARGIVRASQGRPLSVPVGWLSAWAGTGVVMVLVVFNLATVPRHKDVLVLGGACVVCAAIAASVVEVAVLALPSGSGQGSRGVRLRWAIGCCAVAAVSLALTIPLDMLRIERENRYFKKMTLRIPAE